MRFLLTAFLLCLFPVALAYPSNNSPFLQPFLNNDVETLHMSNDTLDAPDSNTRTALGSFDLLKRQMCPMNYNSCSTIAAAGAGSCCGTDSVCSFDNIGNVACCPIGSFCTGTISRPSATSSPASVAVTAVTGVSIVSIITITATTASSVLAATTGIASYVPNSYFPYPYIPLTFAGSAACVSAYSSCALNYVQCTVDLQGGAAGFAVTIVAPGGGITVSALATTNLGPASATSICSSLSSLACPGSSARCSAFPAIIGTGSAERVRGKGSRWVGLLVSVLVGVVEWL